MAAVVGSPDSASADLITSSDEAFLSSFDRLQYSEKSKQLLSKAVVAFKSQDLERCRARLTTAQAMDNQLPHVEVMLARMFMADRKFETAIELLEKHTKSHRSDPEAYKSFGEIALSSGRPTDAWVQLQHARTVAETATFSKTRRTFFDIELTRLLAMTAEKREDFATAVRLLGDLEKMSPQVGHTSWSLGRIKIAQGDLKSGYQLLKRARQLTGTLPQPELAIALSFASADKDQQADVWFKNGVKAEDCTETNWLDYFRWLLQKDRPEDVERLLKTVREDYLKQRDMQFIAAMTQRCLGDNVAAERILTALLSRFPDDLELQDQMALVLIESTDPKKQVQARRLSALNLSQKPDLRRSIATAGWIEFILGELDKASKLFGKLIRSGAVTSQTAFYLGRFRETQGKIDAARKLDELAIGGSDIFPQRRQIQHRATPNAPTGVFPGK